jgi:hypothetical protein
MTLDASGQLGIGTTSPATKLHIVGNVAMTGANPGIFMNGSAVDQTSLISNANGPNTILKFRAGSFIWVNSDDTERMRITNGGNVGIGTTSPTSTQGWSRILDISGNSNTSALILRYASGVQESVIGTDGGGMYLDVSGAATGTTNNIIFRTTSTNSNYSPTERMRITSGGTVNINGTQTSDRFSVQGSNNGTSIGLQGAGLVRTYFASAAAGATFDAFRFLTESGTVYKTSGICGYLYLTFTDSATSGNQKSYIYSIITTGNGTSPGPYNFDVVSTGATRGTNPVSSISLVNDGSGGGVKVQVTAVSGTIDGIYCYATFVGTAV